MKETRYDMLKAGDVILFHGAKVRINKTVEIPAPANEYYPNEKTIYFNIEPYDNETIEILGDFYSHGTYGEIGCLLANLID